METQKQGIMERFSQLMEKRVVPVATKISHQRHLAALRDGLTILIPFTVIGGIALMLANPPVDLATMKGNNIFTQFMIAWKHFADAHNAVLTIPFDLSIGLISVYAVCGVSYRLAQKYKMDGFSNALTALFTFLCVAAIPEVIKENKYLTLSKLGSGSLFAAIVIALVVVEINRLLIEHNIKIRMPQGIPPMVAAPFEILIPMIVNMLVFIGADLILKNTLNFGFSDAIFHVFQPFIHATSSLPSMLLICELTVVFWFFGVHGDNMVSFVTTPIFTGNLVANLEAYQDGKAVPNTVAGNFTFIFGLAIAYLAILFVLNTVNKNKRLRSLGRMSIPSSLFNINEPLVFGVPTVLNVMTFIPTLICVAINIVVAYTLTDIGFIARTCVSLPWTLPAPLYAILSTMDWKAGVVWVALFAINVVVFIPFMRSYEKQVEQEEQEALA
ncbi:PTS system, cellobiose-specific IIC component [Pilibacter termitis]|uniref:Permease IIC component n=1 Tax=Pilibacter termitis TaxID=263852 RepID=A0A1T4L156_9ENTE|nr:PTS transporter subunit EIIC [Pilibacter termitis]SJZ48270.1 PTS system, cellobiose-specific IIC component [Pilibacter termitis]